MEIFFPSLNDQNTVFDTLMLQQKLFYQIDCDNAIPIYFPQDKNCMKRILSGKAIDTM